MDVLFLYRGQTFLWDGRKAIENRTKHRLTFETACEAFFDPAFLTEDASVEEESRMALIGTNIQEDLLYVVHLEREESQIRLISAREATMRERRLYEDGC